MMEYKSSDPVKLSGDGRAVIAVDQRILPEKWEEMTITNAEQAYEAIKTLAVRGAPCIGVFAGYAVYVCAIAHKDEFEFLDSLKKDCELIVSARPTAVNLSWAVKRMLSCVDEKASPDETVQRLKAEAIAIHEEDIAICRAIAEYGLELIKDGSSVITHCNAGALATSRYGTGLGALLLGAERGMSFHAYVDETRPLLQGARLTAYELHNAGVDTTLMCDNMASYIMSTGKINACMVGCDRVAANGDTANKIGTSGLAVMAKHYGVPFYVFCPSSTIDLNCKSGKDIVIEQRPSEEITTLYYSRQIAPKGIKCLNPAFDVTPSGLITAIVTEKGILYPPYDMTKFIG